MKIWRTEVLGDLPARLLCALHRDICRIRSGAWKPYHGPRSWYYGLPWGALAWYHARVLREMKRRGWKPNTQWHDPLYRGATPALDDDMVDTGALGNKGWLDIFNRTCPNTEAEDRAALDAWERRHK